MNTKNIGQDDWIEPNMNVDPSRMKFPPGFIPQPGEPVPNYVPNTPHNSHIPDDPRNIQTPEEAFAYVQKHMGGPVPQQTIQQPPREQYTNPLQKYYRIPGLNVALPSRGYFNQNEIDFTSNGEVPIFPMTASDELLLKNPDALMGGNCIENLIKSCCPSIQNPKTLPIQDADVIMLAVRAATYGNTMTFEVNCPKCETKNEYKIFIRELLEDISFLEQEYAIQLDNGLVVYLKPYTLELQNKLNLATFQEAKKMQYIEGGDLPDDAKLKKFSESFAKLTEVNVELTAASIIGIMTPDGPVTDKKFIFDFLKNCSRQYTKVIDSTLKEMGAKGLNKKKSIKCSNETCGHEWESDLVFDPTSFFE